MRSSMIVDGFCIATSFNPLSGVSNSADYIIIRPHHARTTGCIGRHGEVVVVRMAMAELHCPATGPNQQRKGLLRAHVAPGRRRDMHVPRCSLRGGEGVLPPSRCSLRRGYQTVARRACTTCSASATIILYDLKYNWTKL